MLDFASRTAARLGCVLVALAASHASGAGQDRAAGEKTITAADLAAHLRTLAAPELEGRDTPSSGLTRAQDYVAGTWFAAGLELAPDVPQPAKDLAPDEFERRMLAGYRRTYKIPLSEPDPDGSSLALEQARAEPRTFALHTDFVPLSHAEGEARGEVEFVGYGIESQAEKFDEIPQKGLKGKIALILEGEPRSARRFEGPELSADADLWQKLVRLRKAGAEGVLLVRRPPAAAQKPAKPGEPVAPATLGFRYTFADWVGVRGMSRAEIEKLLMLPCVEISVKVASEILGEDVEALAAKIDSSVRPLRREAKGRAVALRSKTRRADVDVANLVGWIPGSDPTLRGECVIVGAHLDHIGVDERGRIGQGADDNASGSAALIEIAEALCAVRPKRSVMICSFSGEEDGLLGSKALAERLPVEAKSVVAMINMDMLGIGEKDSCAVLGIVQNPALEKTVDRAQRLSRTGIREVTMRKGEELFQRSDHYSFHKIGLPVLFFIEGPLEQNPDYHTWRDTLDKLDQEKVLNIARLAYNCTWLLTDDANRPPPPSASR